MNTDYITATELKRNISEVLNSVYYKKTTTVVEKFGKAIAKIVPISEDRINAKKEATDKLSSFFGVLPDFPEVKDARKFKRKAVSL